MAPSHGAHTIRFSFLSFVPFRLLGSCRRLHKGRLLVRKALVYVLTSANCPSRCSRPATRFSPVGLRDVCCGGERGPMWSVGLNARCACVFLLSCFTFICVVEMGASHFDRGRRSMDEWTSFVCTCGESHNIRMTLRLRMNTPKSA